MKIFLLSALLALTATNAIAFTCEVGGRNGLCDENAAAERKAKKEARLNCIRSGQDPNKCPSF